MIPLRLAPLAGLDKYLQPVIARGKVRYAGEPVAAVLADTPRPRRGRARAHRASTSSRFPPCRIGMPRQKDDVLLFEANETNVATHLTAGLGDADAAFPQRAITSPRNLSLSSPHAPRRWRHAG